MTFAKAIMVDGRKKLKKELKDGHWRLGEYVKIKSQRSGDKIFGKVAEKELSAVLTVADKDRRKYSDSIRGQSAQLAELKNQYMSG